MIKTYALSLSRVPHKNNTKMGLKITKLVVVSCFSFFVIMMILLELSDKTNFFHENTNTTDNVTSVRAPPMKRQLKSIIETDEQKPTTQKPRQLTTRAKRYIEQHSANVQDFNAQQLERLYERLGFR